MIALGVPACASLSDGEFAHRLVIDGSSDPVVVELARRLEEAAERIDELEEEIEADRDLVKACNARGWWDEDDLPDELEAKGERRWRPPSSLTDSELVRWLAPATDPVVRMLVERLEARGLTP